MYKIKNRSKKSWLFLTLPVGVALVGLTIYGVIGAAKDRDPSVVSNQNYSPPTSEEKASGDEKKQEIVSNNNGPGNQPPAQANVVIVDAGQYNNEIGVRAFVANILQDGTCEFTFVQGSARVIRETPAFKDATTTQCRPLTVSRSAFTNTGPWEVSVRYYNADVEGSNKKTFNIN